MVTWTQASSDLRKRILDAKEFELKQLSKADPKMINSIARMVFNFLDTDRDGYLSEPELTQGTNTPTNTPNNTPANTPANTPSN